MAEPMYRQIADDLRERIESGELRPGHQLLTELELREQYKASRNTVRDAIKWLTSRGLVETKPGHGTFVVKKVTPYVTTLTADPKQEPGWGQIVLGPEEGESDACDGGPLSARSKTEPQVEVQKASGEVATRLGLPAGAQVISRHEKRFIEETPYSMQTSYYPMQFALDGARRLLEAGDIKEGTVKYLADALDRRQVGYRDWITVRVPNATESEFFSVHRDGRVAVYEIFRTAYDQTGSPMRLTITVYPADRNQFTVNVGDVAKFLPAPDGESKT